jgi:hypothetical protein
MMLTYLIYFSDLQKWWYVWGICTEHHKVWRKTIHHGKVRRSAPMIDSHIKTIAEPASIFGAQLLRRLNLGC